MNAQRSTPCAQRTPGRREPLRAVSTPRASSPAVPARCARCRGARARPRGSAPTGGDRHSRARPRRARGLGRRRSRCPRQPDRPRGRLESVTEGVYVSGTAHAPLAGECARCLDPVADEIDVEIGGAVRLPGQRHRRDHRRRRAPARRSTSRSTSTRSCATPWSLDLPLAPLCRDDCPGLCAECGERWADLAPDHGHETLDPRWAALTGAPARRELTPYPFGTSARRTTVAVPKRRMSRSNTRSRRSQWKATAPTSSPARTAPAAAASPRTSPAPPAVSTTAARSSARPEPPRRGGGTRASPGARGGPGPLLLSWVSRSISRTSS